MFKNNKKISIKSKGTTADNNTLKSSKSENFFNEMYKANALEYRVPSIPQKDSRGFELEKSTGLYKKRVNLTKLKGYSGVNGDTVGPDRYELLHPEDWRRKGTSWSRYKWENNKKKIRPKTSYNVNHIDCKLGNFRKEGNKEWTDDNVSLINGKSIDFSLGSNSSFGTKFMRLTSKEHLNSLYRSYAAKQIIFRDRGARELDRLKSASVKDNLPFYCKSDTVKFPGPGYYYDQTKHSSFKRAVERPVKNNLDTNYLFAELRELDIKDYIDPFKKKKLLIKQTNTEKLGPAYYFKGEEYDNFKKLVKKNREKFNVPFMSSADKFYVYKPHSKLKGENESFISNSSNLSSWKNVNNIIWL